MEKLIKILLLLENILCLYRNYSWLGKLSRLLICLRVFFEFLVLIVINIIHSQYKTTRAYEDIFYCHVHSFFTTFVMFASLYHSKNFKKLLDHVDSFKNYFESDENLNRKRKFKVNAVICYLLLCTLIDTLLIIYFYVSPVFEDFDDGSHVVNFLFELSLHLGDFRVRLEFAVVNCGLFISYDKFYSIISSVNAEIDENLAQNDNVRTDHDMTASFIQRKAILYGKWANAYITIEKCSYLYNVIFSTQLTTMIIIIVLNFILLTYKWTLLSVTDQDHLTLIVSCLYTLLITEFLVALLTLSIAAQAVSSRAAMFRRRLAVLLAHSVRCEMQYKAISDLLRLVRARPVELKVFGNFDVDMTLLPACAAISTSNAVTALQFKNIV